MLYLISVRGTEPAGINCREKFTSQKCFLHVMDTIHVHVCMCSCFNTQEDKKTFFLVFMVLIKVPVLSTPVNVWPNFARYQIYKYCLMSIFLTDTIIKIWHIPNLVTQTNLFYGVLSQLDI
jgi:hypothetical protein